MAGPVQPLARVGGVKLSAASHVCGRLLLLVLVGVGCWLLVTVTRQPLAAENQQWPAAAAELTSAAEGRYRGRPISQLWADGLPEQAWFTDPQCRRFVTRFTRDDCLEVVRLASFPRSGNTWTRYLLEAATGLFTSSGGPTYFSYIKYGNTRLTNESFWQYARSLKSAELTKLGYLGEIGYWTQGNTIVMKTHKLPEPWNATEAETAGHDWAVFEPATERRAILVIRDPFKTLISLQTYSLTGSVLSNDRTAEALFQGKRWEDFVLYYAQHWFDLNAQWVQALNVTYVVPYEHLTHNTMEELEGMLKFLDVEPSPERMECVRRHLEGKAHNKKHGVVPTKDIFSLHMRAEVWSHIHQLNWVMKDNGLRELPLTHYSFSEEFLDIERNAPSP